MAGIFDLFSGFTKADTGSLLGGIGQLASAWGNYSANNKQNKLLIDQLNYEKQKDTLANKRYDEDRAAINDAFGITKKKKTDTTGDTYALNTLNG